MKLNVFCDELCNDLVNGISIARQVVNRDAIISKTITEQITTKIGLLGRKFRVIVIDAAKIENYCEMLKFVLHSSFLDQKFSPKDTMVERLDFEGCKEESELDYQAQCMFSDFAINNIITLLVINNYECVKSIWKCKDYGNMRALISSCEGLSILLLSDRSAFEVSEEPAGSSPFYNIFDEPVFIEV